MMRKFLNKLLRLIEILIIIAVTVIIAKIVIASENKQEMLHNLQYIFIAFSYVFFIAIPVLLVYIYSIVRCFAGKDNRYNAICRFLHIVNILLLIASYLYKPSVPVIDGKIMAENYEKNKQEIYILIEYIRRNLGDSCEIIYKCKYNKVYGLSVGNKGQWKHIKDVSKDSLLRFVGLSPEKFDTIIHMMSVANIQGFEIQKESTCSELLFTWYGDIPYSYQIYSPFSKTDIDEYVENGYNDSVYFCQDGIYPCGRVYFR